MRTTPLHTITGNYSQGIVGVSVTIIASRNTITRNATNGMQNSSGAFYTYNETIGSPLGGL